MLQGALESIHNRWLTYDEHGDCVSVPVHPKLPAHVVARDDRRGKNHEPLALLLPQVAERADFGPGDAPKEEQGTWPHPVAAGVVGPPVRVGARVRVRFRCRG